MAHELRREHHLLPSVQLHNAPRREPQQRNKAEPEIVALADRRRHIYLTVGDERERMSPVHNARREERAQLREILFRHDLLGLRHFMKVQHVDPGVAHVFQKPPVDALLARLLRGDGGKNGAHLLAGVQPVFSSRSSGSSAARCVSEPTRTMKNSSRFER